MVVRSELFPSAKGCPHSNGVVYMNMPGGQGVGLVFLKFTVE